MISQILTFSLDVGWLLLLAAPFELAWEIILFQRSFKWPMFFPWAVPLSVVLIIACFGVWTLLAIISLFEQVQHQKAAKTTATTQSVIGSLQAA
jgi:hypothetical protein